MTTRPRFKSDAFEAIHSAAGGLLRVGAIDKATMREFDESCLAVLPEISAADIKRIREQAHVSQPPGLALPVGMVGLQRLVVLREPLFECRGRCC